MILQLESSEFTSKVNRRDQCQRCDFMYTHFQFLENTFLATHEIRDFNKSMTFKSEFEYVMRCKYHTSIKYHVLIEYQSNIEYHTSIEYHISNIIYI